MIMKPEISIITVGMNHLSYVKEMLASLYSVGSPSVSFEVIFVDNCSTDGTADYIRNNYPTIKLIENQKKYGFARNNNIGAKHAIGNYILILNPDIILTQGAIDKLYNYAIKHPSCGIVAPKLQNRDCSLQYSARRFPSIKILLNRALLILFSNNDSKYPYLLHTRRISRQILLVHCRMCERSKTLLPYTNRPL